MLVITIRGSRGGGLVRTYPARIWVEESPPHPIFQHIFHFSTSVQEDTKHSLSQVYYACVFFCLCWFCGVVCHCVFLRDRRNDQGWMEIDQRCAQRAELGVSTRDIDILENWIR